MCDGRFIIKKNTTTEFVFNFQKENKFVQINFVDFIAEML